MEIKDLFLREKIEKVGVLPFSCCPVDRPDFITRRGIDPASLQSAILFLVPYYAGEEKEWNISLYARSYDYHAFCADLFSRLTESLEKAYGKHFWGFADKSPIPETVAASKAGLGVIGDNRLLINETYGTFVFIGEILTDAAPEDLGFSSKGKFEAQGCSHCGACRRACPMTDSGMDCLSAVTQKKGVLSPEEEAYIRKSGYAWGCDICQLACPLVQKAVAGGVKTSISFFYRDRIPFLTKEAICEMDDKTFSSRAFSWRGRDTVLRNLALFEKNGQK